MSIHQFLLALRARFGVFAILLTATILAATVGSFLLPKTYRATVSLLVDAKNEQSLSNVLPLILPQEKLSYLQTQMDIITSKRVARKVVQDLKLAENPSTRADFEKAAGSLPAFVARYVDPATAAALREPGVRIEFLDYDWSLNGR